MNWKFWEKSADKIISENEMFVPHEILEGKYQNTNIQDSIPKIYKKDGLLVKDYSCGCKFENNIKSFGFCNHWCDQHAPKGTFQRPIGLSKEGN